MHLFAQVALPKKVYILVFRGMFMRSPVDLADLFFLCIAEHLTATNPGAEHADGRGCPLWLQAIRQTPKFPRSNVDGMSGKRMQVPEFRTAAGAAASAAVKSRHKLLSRRSGAPLVTVVEKSGSARIGR
jgi:hypothetical protein